MLKKNLQKKALQNLLIKNFKIETDNISLFANGIKVLCFDKMVNRAEVTNNEIIHLIDEIKFDISKGPQNPAQFLDSKTSVC